MSWAPSEAKPTGSKSLGWGEGSPLPLKTEGPSWLESPRESHRRETPGLRTSQPGQYGSSSSRLIPSRRTFSRTPGSRVIGERFTDVASAMSIPHHNVQPQGSWVCEGEPKWTVRCILRCEEIHLCLAINPPNVLHHLGVEPPFSGPQPLPQQDVCSYIFM
ncbi:hypothetical protein PO909_033997 [Leuciscus waleckii]